ncbi:uncharacterized protein LOC133194971 [Saccostrea echinata]|uniref:uncharacterized protein LOC133194971 n=1 Tax=Saccostrea echinata TaxID=191078 RepID=UPI002A825E8B|nr:uncharacterized protein LOC133194971 [Saccostrea echinata]
MGKSYGRWSNLVVWTLLHLVKCKPQECTSLPVFGGESPGDYCERTLHHLNCSVGPREKIERDTVLLCQIKRKKGWDAYNETLGDLSHCLECEPSKLTSIRMVRITRRDYLDDVASFPTIQLNFTVPKPTVNKDFYTGGISMTFTSYDDPTFETRYRLLDFSNYSYSSPDSDKNHQRVLSFPCFMGYQHEPCKSDNYKVYTLTLTAFSKHKTSLQETPFTELSYNITIYSYYVYNPLRWKSTIAVAFFPTEKDVTILFDPMPNPVSDTTYSVSLVKVYNNKTTRNKMIVSDKYHHCFQEVDAGIYYILIEVITTDDKCSDSCRFTKSHTFEIRNSNSMKAAAVAGNGPSHAEHMVIPSVGGGVLALLLLGVLCYYRWKNNLQLKDTEIYSSPKILLIYSNNRKENITLATEFAKFCRRKLQIDLIYDKLKDEITKIEDVGYASWYTEKLEEFPAAVILWTPGSDIKAEETDKSNEFNVGVTFALNSKTNDDKRVACVYFAKAHKGAISRDIQKEVRVFCIPKKSVELATYLHGHRRLHTINIDKDSDLENAILAFNTNNKSNDAMIVTSAQKEIIEFEETKVLSEKELDEEISVLKEEFRQNTGNLSNSSKSSASNAEHIIYNPDCPIHGEHSNIKASNHPHPFPERTSRCHKKHHALFHAEAEHQHSCPSKINQEYSDQCLDSFDYSVHNSIEEPLLSEQIGYHVSKRIHSHYHSRIESCHPNPVQGRYPVNDDQGYNSDHIRHTHKNNPPMLLRQYSAGAEYSGASTRTKDYRANQRKRNNLTPYDSDSYDEDSENTPLNHPKFYLEEEDIQPSNSRLKTSNKSCSLDSIESNDSNYSKRSDSISSYDLKMSLQKFI